MDFDCGNDELSPKHVELFPLLDEEPAAPNRPNLRCHGGDALMILVLGSSADSVYPQVISRLRDARHPFVVVDEDHPDQYVVRREACNGHCLFRIIGDGCGGQDPVRSIFVRHAIARTLDPAHLEQMGRLQIDLNRMLCMAACPVLNPPAHSFSNYSKVYQVALLAEAGFDLPPDMVTNLPEEARAFWDECKGQVIYKGVSNVTTLAQVLTPELFARLSLLPHSPTLFQEYIAGVDYRVHVVGDQAFVTRLVAEDVDYRRSLLLEKKHVIVEAASLPLRVIDRCIALTQS